MWGRLGILHGDPAAVRCDDRSLGDPVEAVEHCFCRVALSSGQEPGHGAIDKLRRRHQAEQICRVPRTPQYLSVEYDVQRTYTAGSGGDANLGGVACHQQRLGPAVLLDYLNQPAVSLHTGPDRCHWVIKWFDESRWPNQRTSLLSPWTSEATQVDIQPWH